MHDTSATNVPALAHRPNGKMSGNSGSFPDHDNAEYSGSSHVDIIKDAATKGVTEDNNASDAVSRKRHQLM
jgi:ribosomal protein S20